jgi:UDPglucose--hexose-1-phosphate uridylyltransferase
MGKDNFQTQIREIFGGPRARQVIVRPGEELKKGVCDFCENSDLFSPSIAEFSNKGNTIKVYPHPRPMLGVVPITKTGEGIYNFISGKGAHEMIKESEHHQGGYWSEIRDEELANILVVWQERIKNLKEDKDIRSITVYKRMERETDKHPYSILVAFPVSSPAIKDALSVAKDFFKMKDSCLFCWMIEQEIKSGARVVAESQKFIALVPFDSAFPYQVKIMPKRHESYFEESAGVSDSDLVCFLKRVLIKAEKAVNFSGALTVVVSSPNQKNDAFGPSLGEDYHWQMDVVPHPREIPSFYVATGFPINHVSPEDAARILRGIKD